MQNKRMEYACKNRSFSIKVKISSGPMWTKPIKCVIFHTREVVGPSASDSQGMQTLWLGLDAKLDLMFPHFS